MRGTIVKALAGFYYVYADGTVYECRARGAFRKGGLSPLVGDEVEMTVVAGPGTQPSASSPEMGVGAVDRILERSCSFDRPPVANVDLMVIVVSVKDPAPSFRILDRVALAAEKAGTDILICVSKIDLAEDDILQRTLEHYRGAYPVLTVCAKTGEGMEELRALLKGKKAALAGPSGAGKSTLTNVLTGREVSATGDISEKLKRGRNTTRHCELFRADGFFLFDTPGFTSFENEGLDPAEIAHLFPDFAPYVDCRFDDCRHISEPDCGVIKAVEEGKISRGRYESYKDIYETAVKAGRY